MWRMDRHPSRRPVRYQAAGRHDRLPTGAKRWSRQSSHGRHAPALTGQDLRDLAALLEHRSPPPAEGVELRTVLIVEDDAFTRETLGYILEADGYRVLRAADADEALAILCDWPDTRLILMDLLMPNENGRCFLQRLRDDPAWSDIPVIVVSAANYDRKELNVAACFAKPVAIDALRAAVRRHLPPG
jgi:CheY-like chemotaxis protein